VFIVVSNRLTIVTADSIANGHKKSGSSAAFIAVLAFSTIICPARSALPF
jgi:hypothetical protein